METGFKTIFKTKRSRKQKLVGNYSSGISEVVNQENNSSTRTCEFKLKNKNVKVKRCSDESLNCIKRKRAKNLTNLSLRHKIIRRNHNRKVKVKEEYEKRCTGTDKETETLTEESFDSFPYKKLFRKISHLSEETIECKICFKQLKVSSMKQHFKTHSGEKPYPCAVCGARFTRRGDAIRHRKSIHPNAKPFQCSKCSKCFLYRRELISHLQNHDNFFYTCATCGFKFAKKEYYEDHVLFIHPLPERQSLSGAQDIVNSGAQQLEKLLAEETDYGKRPGDEESKERKSGEEKNFPTFQIKIEEEDRYNPGDESCDDPAEEPQTNDAIVTNVQIEKGTLSITQKLLNQGNDGEEEVLVDQAICEAVSQAEAALENIQCTVGNNMTSESLYPKNILGDNNNTVASKRVKNMGPTSEIHVNATVRGLLHKFIIKLPNSPVIDATTQEGLDTIVNVVNYLCSGKELSGPVDVVMHHAL